MLDGILGSQHKKGFFERKGLGADGDLALLHGFKKRRLHLGR